MERFLVRAEVALDLIAPFLGFAAVAFTVPDLLGPVVATGWLVVVLDGYLATMMSRGATSADRLRRLVAPAIVLFTQVFTGTPGWLDWAIQSAVCGMGARALALAAVLVGRLVEEARRSLPMARASLPMVLPGLLLILGFSLVTVRAFAEAWLALHHGWVDVAALAAATSTAVYADVRRLWALTDDAPAEWEHAEVLIIGLLVAWFVAGGALIAWTA